MFTSQSCSRSLLFLPMAAFPSQRLTQSVPSPLRCSRVFDQDSPECPLVIAKFFPTSTASDSSFGFTMVLTSVFQHHVNCTRKYQTFFDLYLLDIHFFLSFYFQSFWVIFFSSLSLLQATYFFIQLGRKFTLSFRWCNYYEIRSYSCHLNSHFQFKHKL